MHYAHFLNFIKIAPLLTFTTTHQPTHPHTLTHPLRCTWPKENAPAGTATIPDCVPAAGILSTGWYPAVAPSTAGTESPTAGTGSQIAGTESLAASGRACTTTLLCPTREVWCAWCGLCGTSGAAAAAAAGAAATDGDGVYARVALRVVGGRSWPSPSGVGTCSSEYNSSTVSGGQCCIESTVSGGRCCIESAVSRVCLSRGKCCINSRVSGGQCCIESTVSGVCLFRGQCCV